MVYLRSTDRITSSATDTDYTDLIGIDSRMIREEIDCRTEIFHSHFGRFHTTRITAALAVVGRIERQCHITHFRQLAGMKPRSLFFDTTERMPDDDGGIFLCRIIVCREIKIADHINQETVVESHFLFLPAILDCLDWCFRVGDQSFALQQFVQNQSAAVGFAVSDVLFDNGQHTA